MARVTLETAGEDVFVGGSDVDVFGTTSGGEVITVNPGSNVVFDSSFAAGGDQIELAGGAASYSVRLSGSRVILTGENGTVVSVPIGTNGIEIDFGNGDVRTLSVSNGAVTLGDQRVTSTEADVTPSVQTETALTAALSSLVAAQTELADFLAENEVESGAELRTELANLQEALADYPTASQLQAGITVARADLASVREDIAAVETIEGRPSLADAIDAYIATNAELQAEQDEFAEARDDRVFAESGFEAANRGDLIFNQDGTASFVDSSNQTFVIISADENGNLVLGPDAARFNGSATVLQASTAYEAAQEELEAALDANSEATADFDAYGVQGNDLRLELENAQVALQSAIDAAAERQALVEQVADAQALVAQVNLLEEGVTDAQDVITEDLGFALPDDLSDGTGTGTAANDIFLLDDTTGSATITDFGAEGNDVIFVGGNIYDVVQLTETQNLGTENLGSASQLEVFVQEVNGDTILYFEDETFSGNTTVGTFQGFEVTLDGVAGSSVEIDNLGFLTVQPELV